MTRHAAFGRYKIATENILQEVMVDRRHGDVSNARNYEKAITAINHYNDDICHL